MTFRGDGGTRRSILFTHRTDEAEAFPRQCFDQALLLARVADCATSGIQPGSQCCIRNAAPIPNGIDEIVLADDALPVSDQVFEQIEHLWCNGNDLCPAMQFAPVGVKCELLEAIAQVAAPHVASHRRKASSHTQRISRWYKKCKPMVGRVLSRGISSDAVEPDFRYGSFASV